jgi:hypothetical protein
MTHLKTGETVNDEEPSNLECQRFYDMLMAANQQFTKGVLNLPYLFQLDHWLLGLIERFLRIV